MSGNKDYLSQEEIDALLRQTIEDGPDETLATDNLDTNQYLTTMEQDALGEIGNITFGSAATALSTLLGKKVDITTPKVSVIARQQLVQEFPQPHVAVSVNYVEGFQGINLLVIKTDDAKVIADLMLGGDGTNTEIELNEIHISAVQEAMNQMMGSSATSMSTIFNRFVNISPPGIDVLDFSKQTDNAAFPLEDVFIKISFRLTIADLIDSSLMQLLPISFAKEMVSTLLGESAAAENENDDSPQERTPAAAAPQTPVQPPVYEAPYQPNSGQPAAQMPPMQPPTQQPLQPQYGQPYQQQYGNFGMTNPARNVNVQPAQFANFAPNQLNSLESANLNLLLDIPLKVTVELGRTEKLIKEILELSQGSIVELDKLAGEPVDILVNNRLIAKGEVVVIDENFGVRVTDIVSQLDRIQKLQ
ncbi:MAG TPA: flagellar motor switch phosphatase FliY [Bacilli bacterium]